MFGNGVATKSRYNWLFATSRHTRTHTHKGEARTEMAEVTELVSAAIDAQNRRNIAFKKFSDAFARYIERAKVDSEEDPEFLTYRQSVHEVTEEFKSISETVSTLRDKLTEMKREDLATLLTEVQTHEKERLELTAYHQCACRDLKDYPGMSDENMKNLKRDILKVENEISLRIDQLRHEL